VTERDRCSLADAAFKEAISGMLQASAASIIRFWVVIALTEWQ
jgi:hypothetical protein